MTAALRGIVATDTEAAIDAAFAGLPDPAGTFYRYGMAGRF